MPRAPAAAASATKDTVRGRLVTSLGAPVIRARIRIGERRALPDGDGYFVIDGVPERYDLHLGKSIAYLGLTRRDPAKGTYDCTLPDLSELGGE